MKNTYIVQIYTDKTWTTIIDEIEELDNAERYANNARLIADVRILQVIINYAQKEIR